MIVLRDEVLSTTHVSISQSRCFSFHGRVCASFFRSPSRFNLAIEMLVISCEKGVTHAAITAGFNLAIEMLFISCDAHNGALATITVSISQSRCLSFQARIRTINRADSGVSISSSRCLSFQDRSKYDWWRTFNVSISQSRCLSFQGKSTR